MDLYLFEFVIIVLLRFYTLTRNGEITIKTKFLCELTVVNEERIMLSLYLFLLILHYIYAKNDVSKYLLLFKTFYVKIHF